METTAQFEVYKDILFKMEIIELPETLKFTGLTSEGLPNFKNIGVYHEKYKPLMMDRHTPYTEIGISFCNSNRGIYLFGCQVDSIDGLPDGLIGLDTGVKRFACCTFRVQPGGDLLGGMDGPGDGMKMAGEYLEKVWIPKNKNLICNYESNNYKFEIKKSENDYRLANISDKNKGEGVEQSYSLSYWIEVYKVMDIANDPEMCFYIPLNQEVK